MLRRSSSFVALAALSLGGQCLAQCEPLWLPQPPGFALDGYVAALAVYQGDLVAAGVFTSAGGHPANRIARWDGAQWHPLGDGIGPIFTEAPVYAMLEYDGQLIVGGTFQSVGGLPIPYLARWDGSSWSSVGGGVDSGVADLVVFRGSLIAAGAFSLAGGVVVNGIAAWDGSTWTDLDGGANWGVWAVTEYHADLVAAGGFTNIGGVSAPKSMARWDGDSWHAIDAPSWGGPEFPLVEVAVHGDDLLVGGVVELAGQSRLVRWDGSAWYPMGAGLSGLFFPPLHVITFRNTPILGEASWPPGAMASVHQWNGSTWVPLGGGVNAAVWALAAHGEELWVGGVFTMAGSLASPYLARWGCPCYADCNNSGGLTVADFTCFQTQFVQSHPYADCDGDGAFAIADFTCFQTKFVAGCP